MNTQNILTADVLDIIFDGKNKAYGAYELRKTYNLRVIKALGVVILVCFLFSVGSIWAKNTKPQALPEGIVIILDPAPQVPEPEKPIEQPKQQAAAVKTVASTIPVIASTVVPEQTMPTLDEFDHHVIGTLNIEGTETDDVVGGKAPTERKGTGLENTPVKKSDADEGMIVVQMEAEFPGGKEGWKKYLEKNLNNSLPAENGANNGKYTVVVSFMVDKEGSISEVVAETDPGFGTAEEAVRIIKRGPKWKPALQNGRTVNYRVKQQITFIVNEG